jgi:serine protease Do
MGIGTVARRRLGLVATAIGLLTHLGGSSHGANFSHAPVSPPISTTVSSHLRAITVQIFSQGQGIGSGTIVAWHQGAYWVLTNRHVLPTHLTNLHLQTSDRLWHRVKVLAIARDRDLALMEFRPANHSSYPVARAASRWPTVGEVVFAAGFPAQDWAAPACHITQGQVAHLLSKPLADGYQIGHHTTIYKGMSGGPMVSAGGELLGLNGIHAQPLWEAQETYADGTEVAEPLQAKIAAASWAIPIREILRWGVTLGDSRIRGGS